MDALEALSALCGWIYTVCWSLSFYPQPLLNARRRSTAGTTVDFPLSNCLGFLSYLLSTGALRYSARVRAEYAARHHGLTPTVAFNDVVFAGHALLLSAVTASQYLLPRLWGWHRSGSGSGSGSESATTAAAAAAGAAGQQESGLLAGEGDRHDRRRRHRRTLRGSHTRPSRFMLGIMLGCVTGVAFVVLLVLRDSGRAGGSGGGAQPYRGAQAMRAHMAAANKKSAGGRPDGGAAGVSSAPASAPASAAQLAAWVVAGRWTWLDVVYALGYVKIVVTLVKYSPQVLANWRNRSTLGWSIAQILLDFGGGVLSIAQLLLDSYRQQDWSGLTGNPVKLLLGNVSMLYDLVFFAQHYVLYPDSRGGGSGGRKHKDDGATGARDAAASEQEGLLSGSV